MIQTRRCGRQTFDNTGLLYETFIRRVFLKNSVICRPFLELKPPQNTPKLCSQTRRAVEKYLRGRRTPEDCLLYALLHMFIQTSTADKNELHKKRKHQLCLELLGLRKPVHLLGESLCLNDCRHSLMGYIYFFFPRDSMVVIGACFGGGRSMMRRASFHTHAASC